MPEKADLESTATGVVVMLFHVARSFRRHCRSLIGLVPFSVVVVALMLTVAVRAVPVDGVMIATVYAIAVADCIDPLSKSVTAAVPIAPVNPLSVSRVFCAPALSASTHEAAMRVRTRGTVSPS